MSRYRNGSIYVTILSILCAVTGIILYYYGNDKIVIHGSKSNGKITIVKSDLKLFMLPLKSESLENVTDVKFRTDTAEDKSLVTSVKLLSPNGTLILIGHYSKVQDKQKRDLFNDLDFFLRNNSPEYSKSYSFTDYTGTAGLILFSLSALVFFSMLIHLLNRILVEKDRTKFVKLKHDTAYALILETNTNKDTNSILPKTLMKLNGKTIAESVVDALKIDEIDKIGIVIDPMNKKLFKRIFKERVSLIEQKESAGPVYSLICAQEWIGEMNGDLLIIPDNVPFITKDVIIKLIREHRRAGNICTILAAPFNKNILPYGIIGRNTVNRVSGIFEAKDLTEDDKKNIEVNTSFYCFKYKHLSGILKKCGTGKEVHDLILPDIINLMIEMKIKVEAIPIKVLKPVYGVNTQEEFKNEGKI